MSTADSSVLQSRVIPRLVYRSRSGSSSGAWKKGMVQSAEVQRRRVSWLQVGVVHDERSCIRWERSEVAGCREIGQIRDEGWLPGKTREIRSPKRRKGIWVAPEGCAGFMGLGRVVKVRKIRDFY